MQPNLIPPKCCYTKESKRKEEDDKFVVGVAFTSKA